MQPLRCPTCRGFDWYRDGFTIREDEDGSLRSARVEPASVDAAQCWCCAICGHELPNWSSLARSLDALKAVRASEIAPAEAERADPIPAGPAEAKDRTSPPETRV